MNRKKGVFYIAVAVLLIGAIVIGGMFLFSDKIIRYQVVFEDFDGTVLKTERVRVGTAATAPADPVRDGYVFIGWGSVFSHVTSDLRVVAQYSYIAEMDPAVFVDKVTANAGDQVQVAVSLKNNPGILGMTLRLTYDESAMTLTDVTRGPALSEMTQFVVPKDLSSGCQFPWAAETAHFSDATNGEILIMTFRVSKFAKAGRYAISLTYDSGAIIDNEMMPVFVKVQNGDITIN